jgi:FMN phosphatase YigB (HAD superfamily)
LDELLIVKLCDVLHIDANLFPRKHSAPRFSVFPFTRPSLTILSTLAPLVTLSNVSCLDMDDRELTAAFGPYVTAHFRSCLIGAAKPDRFAFSAVSSSQGVPVERILHVGDSWECDVLGALNAGASAVWISNGRTAPAGIAPDQLPRFTIAHNLNEATALITAASPHRRRLYE